MVQDRGLSLVELLSALVTGRIWLLQPLGGLPQIDAANWAVASPQAMGMRCAALGNIAVQSRDFTPDSALLA